MTSPNQSSDIETRRVPTDQLEQLFTHFTRNFLIRQSTNSVDVEVLGADSGDQFEADGARIFGITFDPKENSVEFELDGGDHRIINPKEVWVAEEPDGFIKASRGPSGSPDVCAEPGPRDMSVGRNCSRRTRLVLAVRSALSSVDRAGVLAVLAPAFAHAVGSHRPVTVLAALLVRFGQT